MQVTARTRVGEHSIHPSGLLRICIFGQFPHYSRIWLHVSLTANRTLLASPFGMILIAGRMWRNAPG